MLDWSDIRLRTVFEDPLIRTGCGPVSVAQQIAGGRPVYLATPYTKEVVGIDGRWRYERSLIASARAAMELSRLARVGVSALSPIVMAAEMVHAEHAMAVAGLGDPLDPLDVDFWEKWCRPHLNVCEAVVVPDLAGWQDSVGIRMEVSHAIQHQKRVFFYAGAV